MPIPMPHRTVRYLIGILLAGAASMPLYAAELGDVRVSSHIGQQLVADIELALIDDPGQVVGVRLADAEVYRGAGVALPPVLASVHLSVMRREGRQFVHVTSLRPVDADHLHLYLDLDDKGQHNVRLATLWLTPDPNPAPPPLPAPTVQAAVQPAVQHPVQPAPQPTPVAPPAKAPPQARPAAAHPADPGTTGTRPSTAPAAIPAALGRRHAAAEAPACARPSTEAQACVALGVKNAELRAQLGKLETTVKGLQATFGAAAPARQAAEPSPAASQAHADLHASLKQQAEAEAAAAAAAAASASGPKPINSIKPLVPRKPKAAPPEPGLPWGTIAMAGVIIAGLAATAAGVVFALRRRRARAAGEPAGDLPAAEGATEPVLE